MGVMIQDDMWEACRLMPRKQQQPFLMALVEYGMEGTEPTGQPAWLPAFVAFRYRISTSAEMSKRGKAGGMAYSPTKQNDEVLTKQNQSQLDKQNSESLTKQNHELLTNEGKGREGKGSEEEPPAPYASIVGYLNERAGTAFKASSSKTRALIRARIAEGFGEDDFRAVIDAKVSDWANDQKMAKYLRPETLFSNKFEGYLNERHQPKGADYACYD